MAVKDTAEQAKLRSKIIKMTTPGKTERWYALVDPRW